MIISDSLSQPYALLIFSGIGAAFGILYSFNWFVCKFLIKNAVYRHISQILYAILYGISFFAALLEHFDYALHIYHIVISIVSSAIVSLAIILPIMKYKLKIKCKCDAVITKISQSNFAKRIKK